MFQTRIPNLKENHNGNTEKMVLHQVNYLECMQMLQFEATARNDIQTERFDSLAKCNLSVKMFV